MFNTIFNIKGRIVVGIGVFLGLIFIFWVMVYLPKMKYREDLNSRISQQNMRLSGLKKKFRELEQLKEKNEGIKQNLSFLEERLKPSQASFLYELGLRGKIYGIQYIDITPLAAVEEEYYLRTPVNVHLYGKYHNLGMLLSDMAKRGGLGSFSVDSLWLKSYSKDGYTLEAYLTLSLYKYKQISGAGNKGEKTSLGDTGSEVAIRRGR